MTKAEHATQDARAENRNEAAIASAKLKSDNAHDKAVSRAQADIVKDRAVLASLSPQERINRADGRVHTS